MDDSQANGSDLCDLCEVLFEHLLDMRNPQRYSLDAYDQKLHFSSEFLKRGGDFDSLPPDTARTPYNLIRASGGGCAVTTHHGTVSRLASSGETCAVCRLFSASDIFLEGATTYEVNLHEGTGNADDLIFELLPVDGPRQENARLSADAYYLCMRHDFSEDKVPEKIQDAARKRIWGRQVHARSDSEECRQLALKWYKTCQAHERCHRPQGSTLPTRVIDVGRRPADTICLKTTSEVHGKYVALSYCWGDFLPLKLTRDVIKQFEVSIASASLPKTFQDAVEVTQSLGFRYLWIDALCIVQDDPLDVAREVASMHKVYGNCELVLSATSSENCNGGLYSLRNAVATEIRLPKTTNLHTAGTVLIGRYNRHRVAHLDSQPLDRRAWSLQERLLSPAVLHFLPYGLVWECRTVCVSENGEVEVDGIDPFLKALPWLFLGTWTATKYGTWTEIVHKYSSKSMTYKSDRLPAVAGLGSYLHDHEYKHTRYYAGLWESELPWNLVWRTSFPQERSTTTQCQPPSWTWAAVSGAVSYSTWPAELNPKERKSYVTISHIETIPTLPGHFLGHVNGGKIELHGPTQETSFDSKLNSLDQRDFFGHIECFLDIKIPLKRCTCLLVSCLPQVLLNEGEKKSWVADSLILLACSDDDESCCQRVGVVRHYIEGDTQPFPTDVFKHPITRRVTII
ncbi:uncharacterized protein Z520_06373 [Fonsecaea multimorphosa CBS 102226]|uniref:Heterokaryon incompatibility domain-containing protein n=1 Tax=Fonsecaea multimorphosa CBS 102226 TaxID=1442371 RepID=A0A0D2H6V1_9EURO|nr:uncharacterized protein Z520_06373 [Fonsecaea multimorphosa CBS 102226]KIX97595.1 hypothetical protein Z520_06373 [Fonsecaea multimorphosa CBS 102226]OAL24060.1 hypothetical protein AYO22_05941 [Fonsecaea multimorphosa]